MVSEARTTPHPGLDRAFRRRWESEACILAAPSRDSLVERGRTLLEFLAAKPATLPPLVLWKSLFNSSSAESSTDKPRVSNTRHLSP